MNLLVSRQNNGIFFEKSGPAANGSTEHRYKKRAAANSAKGTAATRIIEMTEYQYS